MHGRGLRLSTTKVKKKKKKQQQASQTHRRSNAGVNSLHARRASDRTTLLAKNKQQICISVVMYELVALGHFLVQLNRLIEEGTNKVTISESAAPNYDQIIL